MEVEFRDKIEFETVELEIARDAVVYSFIVQKSLTHLDLSACENTLQVNSIFTEEQCRKRVEPRRQILYTLNLDLPRNLESSLRGAVPIEDDQEAYEAFHLGAIFVSEYLYTRDLPSYIIEVVMSARNKIEKLRRYLNVIRLLKLNHCIRTSMLLFEKLILAFYPFCTDSNFVVEFAITLRFTSWIFHEESPMVIRYVLQHAMAIGYDVRQVSEWRLDSINGCIIFRKPGNISALLEFGNALIFEDYFYLVALDKVVQPRVIQSLVLKNIPQRRFFLILQLFYYFLSKNTSWEGLLYVWRSIPDPCFTENELHFLFRRIILSEDLHNMIDDYKLYIVEETAEINDAVPRTLKHLCRVTVRNTLINNYQLPYGISKLNIPSTLKDYLNLKR